MTCHLSSSDESEAAAPRSAVLHRALNVRPTAIARASGNYLYTEDGRKILDGCGGAAVVSVGHGDERVVSALTEQVRVLRFKG